MAGFSWLRQIVGVIDREYERRIRAASLVTEYGAHHHHDDDVDDDSEAAEILNIPPGSHRQRGVRSEK